LQERNKEERKKGKREEEQRQRDSNKRQEEGGEEKERSTVSQRWPQVDLILLNRTMRREERRGELKECSGLHNPPCPLSLAAPPKSPPAKQGSEGGRKGGGVLVIKLQTFPHLMVLCHVSAFSHSSLALSAPPPKKYNSTYFIITNREQNSQSLELKG